MRLLTLISTGLVLAVASTSVAQETESGFLHLRRYADVELQGGVQHANLYVFDMEGNAVTAADGSQTHTAGAYVEVPTGWYLVSVGTRLSRHNLQQLQVVDGRVTVVPAGWVSALTLPIDEQPSAGCTRWRAELTVSVRAPDGAEELIASNAAVSPEEFGMVQVPAGEVIVHFNGFPTVANVLPEQEFRIPLGYQDPVLGERPQLSLNDGTSGSNTNMALCTDGALHVPAGPYFTSSLVPVTTHPFERRAYVPVVVEPWDWIGHGPLRQPELQHARYSGEGSESRTPGPELAEIVARIGAGGTRPRLPGLGRP